MLFHIIQIFFIIYNVKNDEKKTSSEKYIREYVYHHY